MALPLVAVLLPIVTLALVAQRLWLGRISADDYARVVVLAALYLVYLLKWIGCGVLVSLRARRSSSAIAIVLILWFVMCVLGPPLATSALAQRHPPRDAAAHATALERERAALPSWPARVAGVEERFDLLRARHGAARRGAARVGIMPRGHLLDVVDAAAVSAEELYDRYRQTIAAADDKTELERRF